MSTEAQRAQVDRIDDGLPRYAVMLAAYHRAYAAKAFSNLGHRRVFVIAKSAADARAWATQKGVSHVSSQATESAYSYPTVPPVSFKALTDR